MAPQKEKKKKRKKKKLSPPKKKIAPEEEKKSEISLCYLSYYPHWSRDSVSPVCRIFRNFTEPAHRPLDWFSPKVAMSVCVAVCRSVPPAPRGARM